MKFILPKWTIAIHSDDKPRAYVLLRLVAEITNNIPTNTEKAATTSAISVIRCSSSLSKSKLLKISILILSLFLVPTVSSSPAADKVLKRSVNAYQTLYHCELVAAEMCS